jgi:tetratricopeptide (TPR) repeat protein
MRQKTGLPVCLITGPMALTLLFFGSAAGQQSPTPIAAQADDIRGNEADVSMLASNSKIYVSVREPSGIPVTENATVKVSCPLRNVNVSGPTNDTAQAEFANIPAGDCFVEVSAPGYKTSRERALVAPTTTSAAHQYLYVYLHSTSEAASSARTPTPMNVLKEINEGTEAMRKNRAEEARKHFLKAAQRAPQNADVQYLLGQLESSQNHEDAARGRYEQAIELFPTHEHALLALGEMQLHNKSAGDAGTTLEKAVQANTMSYRAHFFLAVAYLQERKFASAMPQVQRAIELSGDKLPMGHALLGQILAGERDQVAARREFELVLHSYPNDPAAAVARGGIEDLEKPAPTAGKGYAVPDLVLPTNKSVASVAGDASGPAGPWGPSDVDSNKPGVASDVSCSPPDIVKRTGEASIEQIENFEKFMASEHIDHQEIDRHGNPGNIRSHDFSYLAFINRDKSGHIFLQESRDGGSGIDSFPTSLATVGLMGLGSSVFQPGFASALDFTCEGLGQWRGKPAWLMYFRQKPDQQSYLRLWRTHKRIVEVPLKGRVWVAATTYQVLHIETDLREPMIELELTRDHLAIDYGPVAFQHGTSELWLPWYADMYLELHRRRYHHRHTLSNYTLFAVDTHSTIGKPKGAEEPDVRPQTP